MKRTFPAKVIEEEQRVIMTTAAAQAPAPGKLEFKDDYTPDEAERVIRNSKGLPVGVRPKMVWTWKKALLWAAIAIVCACGWAILAVSRGERISAIWFLVVALSSYAIAYRFYAYYIQIKIMRTDDANATPAERVHDGANFERTDRRVLFGQHFAGISGAGPLVGPILAAQMGYLPSTLWIILGVIFAGAVQDMLVLWISAKRRGRSLGQMATDEMGKFGGMILSIFLVVMTAIAMAFLALVAIKAMAASPWAVFSIGMTIPIALIMGCYQRFLRPGRVIETTLLGFVLLVLDIVAGGWIASIPAVAAVFTLDAKQLVIALVIYSFAAAALPHWLLVTPRDYLSTLMKIGTLVLLVIGIIIANPQKQLASIRPYNLPSRFWLFLIQKMGYAPEKKWSEMGKKGCNLLIETLTNDLYQVNGKGAFKEEFVTCGGISLSNIDLHTLESKVCPHLFFAGEVLDIDAITGGFNLQAAWTTGYVVGQHIGE